MGASLEWSARTQRQEHRFPMRGTACVIEPDDVARANIADALRGMGYTTHETGSGAVGGFIVDQICVQLILVNVVLPDAKGLKLIRRIRAACPDAAIVALTQAGAGLGLVLAHIAGADTSLTGPPSNEALSLAVLEATGNQHAAAQPSP